MMGGPPCFDYPKPRKPVHTVPTLALLTWVRLSDAALVADLGKLADFLADAGDDRADVLRGAGIDHEPVATPGVWWVRWGSVWVNCYKHPSRAVAELVRRVRELLGLVVCDRCHGRGGIPVFGQEYDDECHVCSGSGHVVAPRPKACGDGGGFVGVDAEPAPK